MELTIESQAFTKIATEALVIFVHEKDDKIEGVLAEVDAATGGRVRELDASGELTGKLLEMTLIHNPPGLAAKRLLLVGLGKPEKCTGREILRASGAALRFLKTRSVRRMSVLAREQSRDAASAQTVVEGLLLGRWNPTSTRRKRKTGSRRKKFLWLGGRTTRRRRAERWES